MGRFFIPLIVFGVGFLADLALVVLFIRRTFALQVAPELFQQLLLRVELLLRGVELRPCRLEFGAESFLFASRRCIPALGC